MKTPWTQLEAAADAALDVIWYHFAKEGRDSAVFAKFAEYPNAAAWWAQNLGECDHYLWKKLGAMLAGWVQNERYTDLLREMLERERKVFLHDALSANSVGEDIMFSATRWAQSPDRVIRQAGIDVLAAMVRDALNGTPWNTANWALANLYKATAGQDEALKECLDANAEQMKGQDFLQHAITALRNSDQQKLSRLATAPSPAIALPPDDPNYAMIHSLWDAAAAAEAVSE